MTRNRPSSHSSHPYLIGDSLHRNDGQRYATTSHNVNTSTHPSDTAQTSTYSYQSQSTSGQYQHVDPSPRSSYFATQDYPYYSEGNFHFVTPRPWTYVNPNVTDLISNPTVNFNSAAPSPDTNHNSSSNTSQSVLYAGQNRLTAAQLKAHNLDLPPTNGGRRYEQQGQRIGPWDNVGSVGRNGN